MHHSDANWQFASDKTLGHLRRISGCHRQYVNILHPVIADKMLHHPLCFRGVQRQHNGHRCRHGIGRHYRHETVHGATAAPWSYAWHVVDVMTPVCADSHRIYLGLQTLVKNRGKKFCPLSYRLEVIFRLCQRLSWQF